MSEWKNYGDVNPIQHGGFWATQDQINSNCYYVLANEPQENDMHVFNDMYFDLSDNWIDWDAVESSTSKTEDPIQKCQNLFWHYGFAEFGDSKKISTKELKEILNRHKIFFV